MKKFFQDLFLLKFNRFSIIIINLIIGNLIFISGAEKVDPKSFLMVSTSYSAASILVLFLFLHLTVFSKLANSIIAIIASLIIPFLGTILLFIIEKGTSDLSFFSLVENTIAGGFAGIIGLFAYPKLWGPMALLNIFLFIRYNKTLHTNVLDQ